MDPDRAGFPLQVYVAVTLAEHDERSHLRFQRAVRLIPGVVQGDWVTERRTLSSGWWREASTTCSER